MITNLTLIFYQLTFRTITAKLKIQLLGQRLFKGASTRTQPKSPLTSRLFLKFSYINEAHSGGALMSPYCKYTLWHKATLLTNKLHNCRLTDFSEALRIDNERFTRSKKKVRVIIWQLKIDAWFIRWRSLSVAVPWLNLINFTVKIWFNYH